LAGSSQQDSCCACRPVASWFSPRISRIDTDRRSGAGQENHHDTRDKEDLTEDLPLLGAFALLSGEVIAGAAEVRIEVIAPHATDAKVAKVGRSAGQQNAGKFRSQGCEALERKIQTLTSLATVPLRQDLAFLPVLSLVEGANLE
jgi:hypothetical protein